MVRKARLDIQGYFYHVIARGQRKNPLFFSAADRTKFLSILKDLIGIFDILIYAFAIMGNHFHLLLYRGETSLGQFLRQLDTRYAMYFNKKYGTVGHVFQDRPKSLIVLDNRYLLTSIKYIHLNPEKAGFVTDYNDYPFSSASCYLNNINCDIVTKLKVFSGKEGVKKYKEFMEGSGNDYLEIYNNDAIGTEEMYRNLEKRNENRKNSYKAERRHKTSIDIIKEIIIEKYSTLEITVRKNDKLHLKLRKEAIIELYKKGFLQSDIATVFGVTNSAINKVIKRNKV